MIIQGTRSAVSPARTIVEYVLASAAELLCKETVEPLLHQFLHKVAVALCTFLADVRV
jgi:hypothetical protein